MGKACLTQRCLSFSLYLVQAKLLQSLSPSSPRWVQIGSAHLTGGCQGWEQSSYWQAGTQINHPHAQPYRAFCCQKLALLFRSFWVAQLAWGTVFAAADYRCSAPNYTFLFFSPLGKPQKGVLQHYSHKCCGRGAGTVNNTLLCDVQAAPSHSCHTTVSWISWMMILAYCRQFYFFLFCIGKKENTIRKDRKQQFINIIQTCEILLPLRSCSNVWAT